MGRLGDLYGRKQLYVIGFVLFTAAAGLAAIAGSLPELLGARAVQAVGASMTIANGAAIVTASFPPSQRGMGLGIMIATVGAGVATGPVLGGVLVDVLDWRAIFWTRIPLGLVGALLVAAFLRDMPPEKRPKGLDVAGSLVLFLLLSAAVLAVNRGATWGWENWKIIALFAAAAVFVPLFLRIERRSRSPVVDLHLFRQRAFSGGILAALFQFFGLSVVIILMPFYLIDARGFDTLEASAIMAAFPIAMLIFAPLSGLIADRANPRLRATLGLVVVAGGLFTPPPSLARPRSPASSLACLSSAPAPPSSPRPTPCSSWAPSARIDSAPPPPRRRPRAPSATRSASPSGPPSSPPRPPPTPWPAPPSASTTPSSAPRA